MLYKFIDKDKTPWHEPSGFRGGPNKQTWKTTKTKQTKNIKVIQKQSNNQYFNKHTKDNQQYNRHTKAETHASEWVHWWRQSLDGDKEAINKCLFSMN